MVSESLVDELDGGLEMLGIFRGECVAVGGEEDGGSDCLDFRGPF
jgi:hypothetical protein